MRAMQERFCQALAKGMNQSDAYREAGYSPNNALETINSNASVLAKNSKVVARVAELKQAYQVFDTAEFVAEARENVRLGRELKQIGASNGALQLAGKVSGLLIDRVEHSGVVNHHVLPGLSLEQLQGLVAKAETEALEHGWTVVEGEVVEE